MQCTNCMGVILPGTCHRAIRPGGIVPAVCHVEILPGWEAQYRGQPAFGSHKPHLRLHYSPTRHDQGRDYPWFVEVISGPAKRSSRCTFNHQSARGACAAAAMLWF